MNKDYDIIKTAIFANFGITVSFLQHRQEYRTNFAVEIIHLQTLPPTLLFFQQGNMDRMFGLYSGIVLVLNAIGKDKENNAVIEAIFANKRKW